MKRNALLAASGAAFVILAPSRGYAFSEDLCVTQPSGERRTAFIGNCLTAECDAEAGGDTSVCRANVLFDAASASQVATEGRARSMIHVDAVHFLAQAVGLDPSAAYWLAAYDEVADTGHYIPFDMYGLPMEQDERGMPLTTAVLNGWSRGSMETAGVVHHFVAPFVAEGESLAPGCSGDGAPCGLYPDLNDSYHEGHLVHLRTWAFDRGQACAGGITASDPSMSPYESTQCYMNDPAVRFNPEDVPTHLHGTVPAMNGSDGEPVEFDAYSGNQIAHFDPTADELSGIRYADQLDRIISAYYGASLEEVLGERTLAQFTRLARMGVYLHALQDRISHHECTDFSYVTGPDATGRFDYHYDPERCTRDLHAFGHYEEIGWDELPDRTVSALEYTFDEISAFAQRFPYWRVSGYVEAGDDWRTQAIDEVIDVLRVSDGCERLQEMIRLVDRYGFQQMPGNSIENIDTMCSSVPDLRPGGSGRRG